MHTTQHTPTRTVTRYSAASIRGLFWKWVGRIFESGAMFLVAVFILLPIVWLALTSLKPNEVAYSTDVFFQPTLDNFRIIFSNSSIIVNEGTNLQRSVIGLDMWPSTLNSIIVSSATVLIAIPLATMAAYAFSRYRFFGSRVFLVWILTTQFLPAIIVAIPFFTLFRTIEVFGEPLLGSRLGLIIVNMAIVMPYSIWMIKGFIDALPVEVEEAGYVDGCNDFQVLIYVAFPLIRPGIIVASVFAFIMSWNEFLFAFILGRDTRTMQVALTTTSGVNGIMWEQMAAAGMVVMLPIILMTLTVRKNFVNGLTMGAVK